METTYDEIRESMNKDTSESWNLLLGNGFSIDFDSAFRTMSGLEIPEIPLEGLSEEDQKHAADILLSDSELDGKTAENVSIKVEGSSDKKLSNFQNTPLKNLFYRAQAVHPENENAIRDSEAKNCVGFLNPFLKRGKVFSLNYDMLLLWAIVHAYEIKEAGIGELPKYKDGFTNDEDGLLYWEKTEEQNIYYCHGALNIEADNARCYKRYYEERALIPVTRHVFDSNLKSLLLVSGVSANEKQIIIESNEYLKNCFDVMSQISGNLVIIGVKFWPNDKHIIDAISSAYNRNKSKLKIYYGYYSDIDKNHAKEVLTKDHNLNIVYFPTKNIHIWR